MSKEIWRRLLGWAARARANPRFSHEERDFRLAVAERVRAILEAVARDEPIAEHVDSLYSFMRPQLPELVAPKQLEHLPRWAQEDEQGLGDALRAFADRGLEPAARVGRFAESFERQRSAGAAIGLQLGSLFNFATEPGRMPIVRLPVFERLEERFGELPSPDGSIAEVYEHHLRFARRMQEDFAGAGIPAEDMLDTEALLLICWQDHQFWADDDDGRRPRSTPPDRYLAACAIYRDEARYLAEWLEFHRLVGFERFFLYDNLSSDDHLEVLEPYLDDGLVVLHEWPHVPGQMPAYDHCLETHGEESRWIGFFDIDEFVFSPTYRPLSEILTEFEQWPGVCVNLPRFGTSGHRTSPGGLVIEDYLIRLQTNADRTVKSIVDPAAVERARNAHEFVYRRRSAVDENGYPVHGTLTKSASFERLRANHYYSKSEEELREKHKRRTADYSAERRPLPDPVGLARHEAELGVRDATILPYAEAVRGALAKRALAS